jgi:hypothetical protein
MHGRFRYSDLKEAALSWASALWALNTGELLLVYLATLKNTGQLTARVDYVHKIRIQYDYGNSPLVVQCPYGLLNTRLSWRLPFFASALEHSRLMRSGTGGTRSSFHKSRSTLMRSELAARRRA